MTYNRRCDVTGKGMNEGWVFGNGEMYVKYRCDAEKVAIQNYSMEDLDDAYNNGICYYTTWSESDKKEFDNSGNQLSSDEFKFLIGKKISATRYLTNDEMRRFGFHKRSLIFVFEGGDAMILVKDDECNDGGSAIYLEKKASGFEEKLIYTK